ncbi:MAG: DUF87 domain-containing protein, partial [Nanoarchaeota archaeon]|nr:DUF87 domain-containing protein [Nanoarchaeota archaeon]MBU1975907.1 DUF87 domain-containing protein [Nanoarchaeota archaeon]
IEKAQKTDFYKREVNELWKITLRSGKNIKLTPEHPLLTVTGWKETKDLGVGSRIATPRTLNLFGEHSQRECEIKLLAYLIAEGHLGNGFVLFSNTDADILSDFKESVHQFSSELKIREHSKPGCFRIIGNKKKGKVVAKRNALGRFCPGTYFKQEQNPLRRWLETLKLYPVKSNTKFIPKIIFKLPKTQVALFLNRLFSCDGSLYMDKSTGQWRISYCSVSDKLISQVQHLLLRFEIVAIKRKKTMKLNKKVFHSQELELRGQSLTRFLQEIGFFGTKEVLQRKALLETDSLKRNPNVDTIPKDIWKAYRPKNWAEIGSHMGYSTPKALRASVNYSPSRHKLQQIALLDNNEHIQTIAESDIFWDEISNIEKLNGKFTVYDLTVPEHHNFVANDIIVHNSYTLGVIAEGMADLPKEIKQNLSIIMLDTMGIYWTMKYPNKKDADLLRLWDLEPKGKDIVIYCPSGYFDQAKKEGIPVDKPFSVKPRELSAEDWNLTFGIDKNDPAAIFIEKIILNLQESGTEYTIEEIIKAIESDVDTEKNIRENAKNRFYNASRWGLFSKEGTPLSELAKPGQITVLDVSIYATQTGGWSIKSLVIGLVAEKLFIQRMKERKIEEFKDVHKAMNYFGDDNPKKDYPMVWLVIDEAHEFMPNKGKTTATGPLVTILREGRQPGISLVLATQQPGKIHTDVMTQSDTLISHRLTAKLDTDALSALMQSYMRSGLDKILNDLPREKGAAIILDDSNERMFPIRVRPRFTWHGGESPIALNKREEFEL